MRGKQLAAHVRSHATAEMRHLADTRSGLYRAQAPHLGYFQADRIDGLRRRQAVGGLGRIGAFIRFDRDARHLDYVTQAVQVVRTHRLLDDVDVVLHGTLGEHHRVLRSIRLVGIRDQTHAVADLLAHRLQPRDVLSNVAPTLSLRCR